MKEAKGVRHTHYCPDCHKEVECAWDKIYTYGCSGLIVVEVLNKLPSSYMMQCKECHDWQGLKNVFFGIYMAANMIERVKEVMAMDFMEDHLDELVYNQYC